MPTYKEPKTRRHALEKVAYSYRQWKKKLKPYARKKHFTKLDRRRMEALMGERPYSGPIKASDIAAARKLSVEYVRAVDTFQKAVPGLNWFHITLLANEFVVSERDPALALKRLKGKADKELRNLGLNALVFIDVNALPNYPRKGGGGCFLFHVHALAYTDEPFDIGKARKRLASSRSWSCELGAKPTHIGAIPKKKGNPAFWAAYDSKAAHEAKNRVEAEDGTAKLMSTEKGYRPNVAMRLLEGLSQLALRDRFFSVGEAKEIRDEVMRRVTRWHRSRWPGLKVVKEFHVGAFWRRFWKMSRTKGYQPWSFIGSTL